MLEVDALSVRFGGLHAVRGVSFSAPQGAVTALLGPNGAGKTTIFAMLAGFTRPSGGRVRFEGVDVTGWAPERIARAGMVRTFQVTRPFAGLSVAHNIRVGAFLRRTRPREAEAFAREIGTRLGLGAMLDRPAAALTVAGRKRLEVARALATEPKLLLLDEVMAGLNPAEVGEIVAMVKGIGAMGVTIVLIEHVMQAVAALANRAYVVAQGALIAAGTVAEIGADPAVIEAYLGPGAAARLARG